jgi:teichuronic acid biosynthesis glycosyltransferase TuaC
MKILVISYMFPCKRHPTSAIFFANLLKELSPKVDDLLVVTPRPYIPKFLARIRKRWSRWYMDPMTSKQDGLEIIRPYVLTLRGVSFLGINGILWQYSLVNFIKNLIKKRKFDIVLGHNLLPDGIAAGRLAKIFKLLSVTWCIGTDINDFAEYSFMNHYLTKKCLEESHLVLTTSNALENKINRFSNKSINVRAFYRGINISNFQNLPAKESLMRDLQLNFQRRYILFVGRLIYDKGIYELAKAFNIIASKYSDIHLIMIGEEIEKEDFVKKLEAGVSDRVHFKGIIPYREVAHYMKIAELLVLPTWAEGLPNVVMEAMAVGLPVVATDVGGIPEVLENEVTGLSIPAKNAEKLAGAIVRMIEDKNLKETCIRNAKELIHNKFDVKRNVLQLVHLLESLRR